MKLFRYAVVLMFAVVCAHAKQCTCPKIKVAYLNMNTLFTKYFKTVAGSVVFEKKKAEYDEKMKALQSGLEGQMREIKKLEGEAKNELLDMKIRREAEARFKARAEVFMQKRSEFDNEQKRAMQELRRLQMETENSLASELLKFVRSYALANGYTHIYDVSGETMNRMPALLVYPEQLDITNKLVAEVNKGHEKELIEQQAELDKFKVKKQEEINRLKQMRK